MHGRDAQGRYFTILESPVYNDETTGVSLHPLLILHDMVPLIVMMCVIYSNTTTMTLMSSPVIYLLFHSSRLAQTESICIWHTRRMDCCLMFGDPTG